MATSNFLVSFRPIKIGFIVRDGSIEDIIKAIKKGKTFAFIIMDGKFGNAYLGPYYTEEILKLSPNTHVIGLSSDERLKEKFLSNGARYFVKKSDPVEVLDGVIEKILNK